MAVDDRERPAADDVDRRAHGRVLAHAPEAVRRALLVRRLEDRGARRDERLEDLADLPRRVSVAHEDRREVGAYGAQHGQATGLGRVERALVAADPPGRIGLEAERSDQAGAAAAHAVGPARVLLQPVHARPRLAHDHALAAPLGERVSGLPLLSRLREDQVHDVVRAARQQPAAQIVVDHVVRGRDDIGQAHAVVRVVERVERPYLHALWHSPGHPGRVARMPSGRGGQGAAAGEG